MAPLAATELCAVQISRHEGLWQNPLSLGSDERLLCTIPSLVPSIHTPFPFLNRSSPLTPDEASKLRLELTGLETEDVFAVGCVIESADGRLRWQQTS